MGGSKSPTHLHFIYLLIIIVVVLVGYWVAGSWFYAAGAAVGKGYGMVKIWTEWGLYGEFRGRGVYFNLGIIKSPIEGLIWGAEWIGVKKMLNMHQHSFLQVQKSHLGVQLHRDKAGNRSQ